MDDAIRVHKPEWTGKELELVYRYVYGILEGIKSIRQLKELLPERSIGAVKNKVKLIKFGKYKKRKKVD